MLTDEVEINEDIDDLYCSQIKSPKSIDEMPEFYCTWIRLDRIIINSINKYHFRYDETSRKIQLIDGLKTTPFIPNFKVENYKFNNDLIIYKGSNPNSNNKEGFAMVSLENIGNENYLINTLLMKDIQTSIENNNKLNGYFNSERNLELFMPESSSFKKIIYFNHLNFDLTLGNITQNDYKNLKLTFNGLDKKVDLKFSDIFKFENLETLRVKVRKLKFKFLISMITYIITQ